MQQSEIQVLQQNVREVRSQIETACAAAGRAAESVQLVAVTKYAEWPWVAQLAELHQHFGENRPQQLVERALQLPGGQWHLIGQLQRNKVRHVLPHATLIHSVDSLRLLNRIRQVAAELQLRPRILLQVNVTGESSKSGFAPEALQHAWDDVAECAAEVDIAGLMTMAAATDDPEQTRSTFASLRQLRDKLSDRAAKNAGQVTLTELSMGMSGDFRVAIEEGATLVRIGSRLFEGLERQDAP